MRINLKLNEATDYHKKEGWTIDPDICSDVKKFIEGEFDHEEINFKGLTTENIEAVILALENFSESE